LSYGHRAPVPFQHDIWRIRSCQISIRPRALNKLDLCTNLLEWAPAL